MPTHIGVLLSWSRRVRITAAAAAAAAVVLLAGDVADTTPHCSTQCQVASAAQTVAAPEPKPPQPAAVGVFPKPQSVDVNPAAPVSVAAFSGKLDSVTMVNEWGDPVPGALTPGQTGWHPTEQLKYGRTYTMTVAARGPGGM